MADDWRGLCKKQSRLTFLAELCIVGFPYEAPLNPHDI